MTDMIWDINSIQAAMRARGSHWWDPDTMRFFGCCVNETVYQGPGGIFFVSAERQFNRHLPKRYTVRQFLPEQADIDTVGNMGDYATLRQAKARAKHCAAAGTRPGAKAPPHTCVPYVKVKHKPVTVLEQFKADCAKHGKPKHNLTDVSYKRIIKKAWLHHLYMEKLCSDEAFCKQVNAEGDHPLVVALRKSIKALAPYIGASGVIFSGDPRGCTVKLTFPDGFTNDFGKEGYCVPTTLKGGCDD